MCTVSETVNIRMLGPFSAYLGTSQVTPRAAKQRQLLALLAVNAARVVKVSTLTEELWGDSPPRSSITTLQTYIFQLRNRLAAGVSRTRVTRDLLRTMHSGYQLECRTDVEEFHRLVRAGREAAEAGNPQAASTLLGQSLALWRGDALADVLQGRVLEAEAASLEETRLGVLVRRIQADLALNRDADVLGELTLLTARYPMNENFWKLLMIAYYRSGHVARALEAFQRLRVTLNTELGVNPSPRLQRLHQAILSGEPVLAQDASLIEEL